MAQDVSITYDTFRANSFNYPKSSLVVITGTLTVTGTYVTNGFALDLTGRIARGPLHVFFDDDSGYMYKFQRNSGTPASSLVKMYNVQAANAVAEAAHTHAHNAITGTCVLTAGSVAVPTAVHSHAHNAMTGTMALTGGSTAVSTAAHSHAHNAMTGTTAITAGSTAAPTAAHSHAHGAMTGTTAITAGSTAASTAAHGHVFTGTAQAALPINVLDDDTAATNGTQVYLALDLRKTAQGALWSENANGATAYLEDDANTYQVPIIYAPVEEVPIIIADNDAADGVGIALYATPVGGNECIFTCMTGGSVNGSFASESDETNWAVWDNANAAANPGMAIYFDEDAVDANNGTLYVNNPNGTDVYVRGDDGRYLKLTHHADPATPGVLVYFDHDGGDDARLVFVSPTDDASTQVGECGAQAGIAAVEGVWLGPVYFDDDGAEEEYRLSCAIGAAVDAAVYATSGNRMISIQHLADPTDGGDSRVLYFDDDVVDGGDRLLAVNLGNANSTTAFNPAYKINGDIAAGANATEQTHVHANTDMTGTCVLTAGTTGDEQAHVHAHNAMTGTTLTTAGSTGAGTSHNHQWPAADATLLEIDNAANPGTLTIEFMAIGYR